MPPVPRKTLAMVQTAPRKLEARDLPIPDIGDDAGLIRIEACGICGSDYEQYEGALRTPMPVIPGHEPLGVVAKIGDVAARRWEIDVGDRIAVETMLSCRFCSPCLGGRYHLCDSRRNDVSPVPNSAKLHGLVQAIYRNFPSTSLTRNQSNDFRPCYLNTVFSRN